MAGDDQDAPAADEPAWQRNRRLRQARIEAELELGQQLVERYGRGVPRPRFAAVGHAKAKRKAVRRHGP